MLIPLTWDTHSGVKPITEFAEVVKNIRNIGLGSVNQPTRGGIDLPRVEEPLETAPNRQGTCGVLVESKLLGTRNGRNRVVAPVARSVLGIPDGE